MSSFNQSGNLSRNPFTKFFSEESSKRHWEVVVAAREMEKFFSEQSGKIDKSSPEFQIRFDRLIKALSKQSTEEKKRTVRFVQRKIVNGELKLGILYYLERRYVPTTKTFRIAFQSLTEQERFQAHVNDKINPQNGNLMLKLLDKKSSTAEFLPIYMKFKEMLRALNWLEVEVESKNKEKEPVASSKSKQTSPPESESSAEEIQTPPEKKRRAKRKATLEKNSNQEDEELSRTGKKKVVSKKSRKENNVQMQKFIGTSSEELEMNS